MVLQLKITDSGKKNASRYDRYKILIEQKQNSNFPQEGFSAYYYPTFQELQDLHLQLSKILLEK